ncbi:MAG TPA: DNA primase [Thiotrichales bacterium]|nr:DNA primase [Thiotrichales bacterium]
MAGRIPQTFIEELLSRVDIVDVIERFVPLKRAGREYVACCPFHDEKTPSFTVSPAKQFYHCFGCGAHGSALGFLMEYNRLEFPEAVEELASSVGLEVPREKGDVRREEKSRSLLEVLEEAAEFYRRQFREHPDGPRAAAYLKGRGLSGETAARFALGFAPPGWENLAASLGRDPGRRRLLLEAGLLKQKEGGGVYDRFRDRIIFPIRDPRGRVVGFGGRLLEGEGPKYLNTPETAVFHKGRTLYGLHEMRQARGKFGQVVVVEGYMDVIALAQHGIGYAVATLGTATTAEHLERLYRTVPRVVFCFDGDRAGREAAWRALEQALPLMRDGREAAFLFLPQGEDPDTLVRAEGAEAFEARLEGAEPLSDYLVRHLLEEAGGDSVDSRARLAALAAPLLRRMPTSIYRRLTLEQLARRVGLPPDELERGMDARPATSPGRRGPRPRGGVQRRTPVRLAIALLLDNPALAAEVGEIEEIRGLEMPGVELLLELLETARERPDITTGSLLERWRDRPEYPHLSRLATMELAGSEAERLRELQETLLHLAGLRHERRWRELQEKLTREGLSDEEMEEWRRLLRKPTGEDLV